MSLSKYFKNSDSFQPEKIIKAGKNADTGWKTSVKEDQPESFNPDQVIKAENISSGSHLSSPLETEQVDDGKTDVSSQFADPVPSLEAEEIEKQIKNAFEEGVKKGIEKAEEDFGSTTRSFATLCRQLDTVRETIIGNSTRELQEFALTIAERIIRTSLRDNDTTIIATIEEALQRAVKSDEFSIYIHPDDYDTVVAKTDDLIAGLSGLSNIVIKKDITVEKGGAKIESDNCTIDATIAGQFDVILDEMKKRL